MLAGLELIEEQPGGLGAELLEQHLGHTVEKRLLPMQPGDVADTWADVSALRRDVGYAPETSIEDGVAKFVQWYREYHA